MLGYYKEFPSCVFFFNYSAPTEIYTLSLHDALPIWSPSTRASTEACIRSSAFLLKRWRPTRSTRSEEHTSELQSRLHLVCRLLLEKKNHSCNSLFSMFRTNKYCSTRFCRY